MKLLLKIIAGLFLLAFGAGVVVVGDQNGWFRKSASIQNGTTCYHGLNALECAFCDESLIEKKGECKAHGVPEAFCTRCNRSLIPAFQSLNDWCGEHNLPESQCTICNPDILEKKNNQNMTSSEPKPIKLAADRHLLRNRQLPSETCTTESLKIQFLSPQTAQKAGLEYEEVLMRPITETLTCYVELTYDGNRFAHLSPRVSGVITQVTTDLGSFVREGEVLAYIDSSEFGLAKAEYLQANALVILWEKNFEREKGLLKNQASTDREVFEARTKLTENQIELLRSEQRLKNLGLSEREIAEILTQSISTSILPLTAPFDGVLVERKAVIGEVVQLSDILFSISDTTHMWAILDVYESDASKVTLGQSAVVTFGHQSGEPFRGEISWISSNLDPKTRTAKARVELSNSDGVLKAGMYGQARVNIKEEAPFLIVTKSAVQWEGCCNVLFAKQNNYVFEPRKIRIEYEGDSYYGVSGNINQGDTIVTTGSFLLKTEILKGNIGAGCCEIEPGK